MKHGLEQLLYEDMVQEINDLACDVQRDGSCERIKVRTICIISVFNPCSIRGSLLLFSANNSPPKAAPELGAARDF